MTNFNTNKALWDISKNPQEPLPIDINSVYEQDIDFINSDFTDWTWDPANLFKSPFSASITNTTSNNPKQIVLAFNRTVKALQIWFGENNGWDFSNLKVSLLGSWWVQRALYDWSANNTKNTSVNVEFENELFNSLMIEFFTTDTVSLSNITIQKAMYETAQIEGRTPSWEFTNFSATERWNFKVAVEEYWDTPSIDAFARLRVSENFTIFDSKQLHDKQPLFWDEELWWSATSVHVPADAATIMSVTASASDYVIRQTKQRHNYQPWKSQLLFMTFFCPQTTWTTKRIWCFDWTGVNNLDPNNWIFFETDWTISWNIAKNWTVTETVTQDNWNIDKLDWDWISWITYNPASVQILVIDYEWLGVWRVRVWFVIDGLIRYVHYFNHANNPTFTSVYMSTPNLPIRYDITSDWTWACQLAHICSTVISEWWVEQTWILRSVDTWSTNLDADVADTIYAVKWIRLKALYKDVTVLPEFFSMINEAGDDFRWSLCLNPTIAWTFTYSDLANSAVQEATWVTANTVSDEWLVIDSWYAVSGAFWSGWWSDRKFVTSLRIGTQIDWTADEVVLCVTPLTWWANIQWSLTFRELL